jgi:hypothetical protein
MTMLSHETLTAAEVRARLAALRARRDPRDRRGTRYWSATQRAWVIVEPAGNRYRMSVHRGDCGC